jgi:hypothetical protein
VTLWFLFIGLAFPMLILASMTYRIVFLDFAVRDSCAAAARADSFSLGQESGDAVFKANLAHFSGIKASQKIEILIKPLNGDTPVLEPDALPLGSIDTVNNIYFIKAIAKAELAPLVTLNAWPGTNIPGLTCPYPLTVSAQSYVEDPDTLTK